MSNRCVINICKYSEHNKDINKKPELTYMNKIDIFDKLKYENIELLRLAIEEEVSNMLTFEPHPILYVDGEIKDKDIDLNFLDEILKLEPYGNNFTYPKFKITGLIVSEKISKKETITGLFDIEFNNKVYEKCVWFKYDKSPMYKKIKVGDICEFVVTVNENFWKGKRSAKLHIEHAIQVGN